MTTVTPLSSHPRNLVAGEAVHTLLAPLLVGHSTRFVPVAAAYRQTRVTVVRQRPFVAVPAAPKKLVFVPSTPTYRRVDRPVQQVTLCLARSALVDRLTLPIDLHRPVLADRIVVLTDRLVELCLPFDRPFGQVPAVPVDPVVRLTKHPADLVVPPVIPVEHPSARPVDRLPCLVIQDPLVSEQVLLRFLRVVVAFLYQLQKPVAMHPVLDRTLGSIAQRFVWQFGR